MNLKNTLSDVARTGFSELILRSTRYPGSFWAKNRNGAIVEFTASNCGEGYYLLNHEEANDYVEANPGLYLYAVYC